MTSPESSLLALGDRNRLLLLRLILEKPQSVGELTRISGLGQSLVSHHLAVLARHGWVSARREGRQRIYGPAVTGSPLVTVAGWIKRQVAIPTQWRNQVQAGESVRSTRDHDDLEDFLL